MWEEELEQVEKIEDMEALQKGAGKKEKRWKNVLVLGLLLLSLTMFGVAGVTSYRTNAKLLTVREELEEAVSVNMETYLTEYVPDYVVGTVTDGREDVTFTQEQTAELAEVVRETLAEDITNEVLAGKEELDAEKIRSLEEKLTKSVKEKLEQMVLLTMEGLPVKGVDYFTQEELTMIVADTSAQVKAELAKALENVAKNTEGLGKILVKQNNLESEVEALHESVRSQNADNERNWKETQSRLKGLEDKDTDGRLTALEKADVTGRITAIEDANVTGRLTAIEDANVTGRLTALEETDINGRLTRLEGLNTDQRIGILEQLEIAKRLQELEGISAGARLGELENIGAAGRLSALEGLLGVGQGSGGATDGLQQKMSELRQRVEQLQESYDELSTSFQDGCKRIAAACTAKNLAPKSNSPEDIAEAILNIPEVRPQMQTVRMGGFGDNGSMSEGPWKVSPTVNGQQYLSITCDIYNSAAVADCNCWLKVTGEKDGAIVELYTKTGTRPVQGSCNIADGLDLIDIYGYTNLEISAGSDGENFCTGEYTIFY